MYRSCYANCAGWREGFIVLAETVSIIPTMEVMTTPTSWPAPSTSPPAAIEALSTQSDPKAPTDVVAAVQHQEVRSALLRMNTVERHEAIATAISTGDERFVSAAVSGSPTLSGMTAEEQKAALAKWRSTYHPDIATNIAHLRNGLAQLERVGPMLKKWSAALVDEPNAAAVAAAEESERETRRCTPDVRFGSFSDMRRAVADVCFWGSSRRLLPRRLASRPKP
jgi:hypothetical protein